MKNINLKTKKQSFFKYHEKLPKLINSKSYKSFRSYEKLTLAVKLWLQKIYVILIIKDVLFAAK